MRYLTLKRCVGAEVRVVSESTVVRDIVEGLGRVLPRSIGACRPLKKGLPTVAKYALLDLEFPMPPDHPGLRRLRLSELRELGLVGAAARPGTSVEHDSMEDDACVAQMLEEVDSSKLFLRIILDAVGDDRPPHQRMRHTLGKGTPSSYFPRTFSVRDCCITNVPTVWMLKHFYL